MEHSNEHRLIRRTLTEIQEEQRKAGATVAVAPVNARAAQEASRLQNANASTKGITIGSNPNADLVERMVTQGFDPSKATPEEIARQNTGMALADAKQYGTKPGANPAKGVMTAQQQTYANQAAGLNTTASWESGQSIYDAPVSVSASGDGALQQAAIDRLRRDGKTEQEIRTAISSPEFMENISTTMSNTGLGGTARQSAVLTPAQAQSVLANSRNPKERAEAQKVIDEQVNQVKGYDSIPQYNKDGKLVGYKSVENKGKTAEAQQKERERLALEESNRLKSQENKDKLKEFTAGIDTTQIDQTKAQLDQIMSSIQNLSPDLQAAVLPSLISLQQSNNNAAALAKEIIAAQPTEEQIESQYGSLEEYIKSEDAKYKDILARNLETAKEIATYNREMLEMDKNIIDHDAAVAEQKQISANVENEKKLRRQLNRLGIQTDVSGLTYLQTEIQKGADALENLKTANNLVSLKAQLAIGKGYSLEVKQAMDTYEANYLNITSQTTEKLQSIKNSISTAKSDRKKAIIDAKKWELEQKSANDKEARLAISTANKEMREALNQKRDDDRAQEALGWNILNTAIDNYGSLIPQSIIDRVTNMLPPGADIKDIINTSTFAERNSRKIGSGKSGAGILRFSPSEMKPNGTPLGFEEFVAQRKAQIKLSPNLSLEDVKRATDMTLLRAEYNAKSSQHSQLDPNQIILRLEDRIKNSAKNVRENATATVERYLQEGKYKEADMYVDGLGAPLSAQERGDMVQALNARKNVLRIQALLEEFGQQGPVTGRLKDANLWSVKQAELNALVTQTVPGLARGIFKEVGVLTDQDIERYTKTIPNSKSTIEQSRVLTDQLLSTINMSIENQLAVMRDSGLNTRDLRTRFETLDSETPSIPSAAPFSQSQQAWLDSL